MRTNVMVCAIAILMLSISSGLSGVRRTRHGEDQTVAVAIALRVNGAAYAFNGQAVCHHVPVGRHLQHARRAMVRAAKRQAEQYEPHPLASLGGRQ